jgi:hypothetical protein
MDCSCEAHQTLCYTILVLTLLYILQLILSRLHGRCRTYITKDQNECAQIIAGKALHTSTNTLSVLESRANANTRLIYTFGIDNAFTTVETKRQNEYRNQVGTLLKPDWNLVAQAAKYQAKQYYPGNLVCLVQSFVLKMTIHVLFQRNLSSLDDATISFVAAEINRLWTASKTPRRAVPWSSQHKIHYSLRELVPQCDPLSPQLNAMNLILPAFETMWRVVLRCFIEVRYRGAKETSTWMAALETYLDNADAQPDASSQHMSTVDAIVYEALRLYPPTRHIHRAYRSARGTSTLATADVEGLHRDENIWGPDAQMFIPSRWTGAKITTEQTKAWMPFGASPFLCPAKPDFGPRMIANLVAALVSAFGDDKFELLEEGSRGQKEVVRFEGPLCSGRNSYAALFIEVDGPCGF